MFKLLFNPSKAIDEARTRKSFGLSLLTAVLSSIYIGTAVFITEFLIRQQSAQNSILSALFIFIAWFVIIFYSGWLLHIIMKTLVGKGDFWAGFTTRAYAMYIISASSLIFSIFWLIQELSKNSFLKQTILVLYAILIPVVLAQAISAHLKAQKELYSTNMTTALVGFFVMIIICLLIFFTVFSYLDWQIYNKFVYFAK